MFDMEADIPDREVRKWAAFCHAGGLLSITGVPFLHVAIPVIIWLARRDDNAFVNEQGKLAVNFQISMAIYFVVAAILVFILKYVLFDFLLWPIIPLLLVGQIGLTLVGAIRAYDGESFRYPFTLHEFVK